MFAAFRSRIEPEGPGAAAIVCWDRRARVNRVDGRVKLRVLVDVASVEIFANDGEVVMSGSFQPDAATLAVTLRSDGGSARVVDVTVTEVRPVWNARPGDVTK